MKVDEKASQAHQSLTHSEVKCRERLALLAALGGGRLGEVTPPVGQRHGTLLTVQRDGLLDWHLTPSGGASNQDEKSRLVVVLSALFKMVS